MNNLSSNQNLRIRILFGCGGTGGHIFPAIALAQEFKKLGNEVMFIGNRGGMEEHIVQEEGFPFRAIKVQKLYRKFNPANLLFPFRLASSWLESKKIMKDFKPDAVICTGGFVSGPVGLASIIMKIPLYLHESNSYPGLTTKFLAPHSRITFTVYDKTKSFLKKSRVQKVGVPLAEKKEKATLSSLTEIGLNPEKTVILVTGGSQGSQAINSVIAETLPQIIKRDWQLIWQTGKQGYSHYANKFSNLSGVYIFDFSPLLSSFYRFATLAITRAGAITIAELEANAVPAILIPLPTAAENHQFYNAREQEKKGVAILLPQAELNTQTLLNSMDKILNNYDFYKNNLESLPPNTAKQDIIQAILKDLGKE